MAKEQGRSKREERRVIYPAWTSKRSIRYGLANLKGSKLIRGSSPLFVPDSALSVNRRLCQHKLGICLVVGSLDVVAMAREELKQIYACRPRDENGLVEIALGVGFYRAHDIHASV
jgi:hypothetical protein